MSQFDKYLSNNIDISNKQLDNGNSEVTATLQAPVFLGAATDAEALNVSGITIGEWQNRVNEQVRQSEMFLKAQKEQNQRAMKDQRNLEDQLFGNKKQQNTLADLKSASLPVIVGSDYIQGTISLTDSSSLRNQLIKTHILVKTINLDQFVLPKASIFCYTDNGKYWVDVLSHELWTPDEISYQEFQRLVKELT